MAEEINKENYKYNVRAVASKQVYDSYMGILRISPNNGEDDPTSLLETKGKDIKLSDSNGHVLPITFSSQSFTDGWIYVKTTASDNVYVSKSFTSRSTLSITKGTVNAETSRIIIFEDLSNKETKGILMYPNKRPSSDDILYFNLDVKSNGDIEEKHDFWEEKNEKWVTDGERYKLVEQNLLKQKLSWYNDDGNVKESEKVKIGKTYLTQTNEAGEEVPILYTHDYILGTSATGTTTNTLPTLDEKTHVNKLNGNCTKLSWERIDDIIWQNLDNYLNYRDDMDDRFSVKTIFENDTTYQADPSNVLSGKGASEKEQKWRANAPLLARGVQDGLIMYHAMPFNRYWFHRCRQVLSNMEVSGSGWADIHSDEKNELNTAKSKKLITAASKATLTPHHSLVKDYLLCNGKEVNVTNFPNINLKNDKFFNISQKGAYAEQSNNKYKVRSQVSGTTHYAVFNSLSSKKLPDLFNFQNLSPRFIRGLNFSFNKGSSYIISNEVKFETGTQHRVDTLAESSNNHIMGYCGTSELTQMTDVFGNSSKFFPKEITEVSRLYNSSYDYLDRKWKHYHLLFSVDSSDRNGTNQVIIAESKYHNYGKYGREDLDLNPKTRLRIDWDSIIKDVENTVQIQKQIQKSDVLFRNVSSDGMLGQDWIDYCSSKNHTESYFLNFQPIPTVGLFYNSVVDINKANNGRKYDFSNFYYYDAEGKLHKINTSKGDQQKIKLNESEGIWPISVAGKASFSIKHNHTWVRKRRHGTDQEFGQLFKNDVGKYYFHGIPAQTENQTYSPTNGYLWRTMTSLPLTNCEKLGCGDLSSFDNNKFENKEEILPNNSDYYTYHNVTDQWRETKSFKKDNSYPGTSTEIKTTDNSPYPSHINLLPLIKL